MTRVTFGNRLHRKEKASKNGEKIYSCSMKRPPNVKVQKVQSHFVSWLKSQTLLVCAVTGVCVSLLVSVAVPEQLFFPLKMILSMIEAMILGSILGMFIRMVSGMIEGAIAGMAVSMAVMVTGSLGFSSLFWFTVVGGITGIIFSIPMWYFNRVVKLGKPRKSGNRSKRK